MLSSCDSAIDVSSYLQADPRTDNRLKLIIIRLLNNEGMERLVIHGRLFSSEFVEDCSLAVPCCIHNYSTSSVINALISDVVHTKDYEERSGRMILATTSAQPILIPLSIT